MTATREEMLERRVAAVPLATRKSQPVKWWAFVGVVWLAICAYSATRWLLGGFARPAKTGPDPLPGYMAAAIVVWIVVFALMVVAAVYYAIIRPWRRDRRLSADGLFLIMCVSLWSQDPTMNYSRQYFSYNQHIPNVGCWQCFLPGWQSHSRMLAEGLWGFLVYAGMVWIAFVAGCWMMQQVKSRWPRLGNAGPVIAVALAALIFDFVTEILWIVPGIYVYYGPTKGPGPVLFAGHYYQFALVELLFASAWYALFCSLRFFKNDKGQTVFERGADAVRGSNKRQTGLRVLALIGGANLLMICVYTIPMNWMSIHWDSTPKDIYTRSYYTGENCGEGTQYLCPDDRAPFIVGPNNVYITPEGKIVAPKGIPVQPGQ